MIGNLIKKAKEIAFNNKNTGLSATNVQDAIDELSNELILVKEITATTDSGGCLLTNIPYYYIPVAAIVTNLTHRECSFFVANNYHYIHVTDAIGSANISNTSITVKVYYINPKLASHTNA